MMFKGVFSSASRQKDFLRYDLSIPKRIQVSGTSQKQGRSLTLNGSSLVRKRAHSTQVSDSASVVASLKPNSNPPSPPPSFVYANATRTPDSLDVINSEFNGLPYCSTDSSTVLIRWNEQNSSTFHHIWLRDHCRCPECYHQITKQRLVDTFEILPGIEPDNVEASSEGLKITWSEPHISIYPWDWLRYNSYDQKSRPAIVPKKDAEKVLWGSGTAPSLPKISHDFVMRDDEGLYEWLEKINTYGICFVSDVPPTAEATEKLSRRLGIIRETQYGGFWDFTSDLAKGDTAYTNMALRAHTDTTYYTDPCGLQLFHLLSHTHGNGGFSLLVDGFFVADKIRSVHPDAYELLSTVKIPAHAAGEEELVYSTADVGYPILSHEGGVLRQVRYNNDDRSAMKSIDANIVENWYHALRIWNQYLTSQHAEYWVKLTGGTVVVIDNHRVLHGRSSFTGKRRMCGAYIGMDDFKARLTALREKYAANRSRPESKSEVQNGRGVWSLSF